MSSKQGETADRASPDSLSTEHDVDNCSAKEGEPSQAAVTAAEATEPQPKAQAEPSLDVEGAGLGSRNNTQCKPEPKHVAHIEGKGEQGASAVAVDQGDITGSSNRNHHSSYSKSDRRLPCIEQPIRTRLVSVRTGRRLLVTKDGSVSTTAPHSATKRKSNNDSEVFLLLPDPEGTVTIRNAKFSRCLGARRADPGEGEKVTAVKADEAGDRERWCLFKGGGDGGCYVKSVETSANLCVNGSTGEVSLSLLMTQNSSHEEGSSAVESTSDDELWQLELLTGELCFLSNPSIDRRLRCDMMGLLSFTNQTKGWEVWRFVEAGGGRVKINSWMHAQHFLCSDPEGKVTTVSDSNGVADGREGWDEWTVEKAPDGYLGVIIKSVAHGRILSFVNDEDRAAAGEGGGLGSFRATSARSMRSMRRMLSSGSESLRNESVSSQGDSDTAEVAVKENESENDAYLFLRTEESFAGGAEKRSVWHLESAHSQTYTFSSSFASTVSSDSADATAAASSVRSLGPFPYVTERAKQAEEIRIDQLQRGDGDEDSDEIVVTLYLVAQEKYLSSTADAEVTALSTVVGEDELWTLTTSPDGSGYNFATKMHDGRMLTHSGRLVNRKFVNGKLQTVVRMDHGEGEGSTNDEGEGGEGAIVWRLDPVLPRAISSGKIKTFAIGTSIAVGTTIAMPFAMAGIVGIMGAESLLATVVTVGLTGAEAIASVGAIGTTAYLVFRESGDSLGMESDEVGEERTSKPYEKRPFCDWRSW